MENKDISMPPFRIGQKIICINNDNINGAACGNLLKVGVVYTVFDIRRANHGLKAGEWVCDLTEIDPYSYQFLCSRFAPIEENFVRIEYSAVLEEEGRLVSSN